MIHATHISKRYGELLALDDVSLEIKGGELYGLIGPDGAGKTTLFRILTTLVLPDSGDVSINTWDFIADAKIIRSKIGYMPGRFSLYQDLTVRENLDFYATIFGTTVEANLDLIDDIYSQLKPFDKRRAGNLSGGMKQKLALCCALVHKPMILFLDEPTTGVDPVSRKEFWDILFRLKQEGMTIIASTPYMDEAQRCDRISLIQNGRIIGTDTPMNLIKGYPDQLWSIRSDDMYQILHFVREQGLAKHSHAFGNQIHISPIAGLSMPQLEALLIQKGFHSFGIQPIEPSIEDCFLRLSAHE